MDEKSAIKIEKTERGVAWTDAEGNRHEYERPIRTLYLQVQSLGAVLSVNRNTDDGPFDKPLSTGLSGRAVIEDRSLSVIGKPETSAKTIDVSFIVLDEAGLERSEQGFKPACLSYAEYEWEFDNEAGWFVQIALPLSQFQLLAQAYESGKLVKLRVGLGMDDMFVDQSHYVPRDRLNWFIEPTQYGAKMVHGELKVLGIGTTPLDLRPPAPPVPEKTDLEASIAESEFQPQPQDTIAPALADLSNKVESVQKTLRWIFWALVVLLFVIGGSRH